MSKKPKESTNKWQKIAEEAATEEELSKQEATPATETEAEAEPAPEADSIEFPSRSKLEDQLTAMEKKVDEYKNLHLRTQAEMENLRRRTERDITNAHKFGTEKLLSELLPVVDSLYHGLQGEVADDPHVKSMREGMNLTLDLLIKTLQKFGVEVLEPAKGDAFNPDLHEAISMQPDPDAPSKTILQVVQKGYRLNGRVLRAAMVIVAQ